MGKTNERWLWNRRMGHTKFDKIVKIITKQVVRDMPKIAKLSNTIHKQCQHGKQTRENFKSKEYSTPKPLKLVHTYLCGPTRTHNLQCENYFMLLIDDYSRMAQVVFHKEKSEAFDKFKAFKALVENEIDLRIECLRLDREGEFISNQFEQFCELHGIKRHFSAARIPQHNGVVERKNRTTQEMVRTMLNEAKLSYRFWREAINAAIYILNRGKIRVNNNKIPYELWKGRPTTIKYFKVFGSKCYIKRNDEDLKKFDSRADDNILPGYSSISKAYRCYNKRFHKIVESENVKVDEARPQKEESQINEHLEEMNCKEEEEEEGQNTKLTSRFVQNKPSKNLILGNKGMRGQTRRRLESAPEHEKFSFLSKIMPKKFTNLAKISIGSMLWKKS
jgi:hypothetical protein